MNNDLKEYVWVFIGCGGTFYAASPYLAVLAKKYCRGRTFFIDPDMVTEGNQSRQWPGYPAGVAKAVTGARAVIGDDDDMTPPTNIYELVSTFRVGDAVLDEATDGRPVLAIVNVDNDEARLSVADWLASRVSPGIMVVSGCESTFGQCYPGVWDDGEAVLDWRTLHPDVVHNIDPAGDPCSAQTIRSNALTGTLVGMCIEDIANWLTRMDLRTALSEFYWDIDSETGRVKMWELLVPTRRAVST